MLLSHPSTSPYSLDLPPMYHKVTVLFPTVSLVWPVIKGLELSNCWLLLYLQQEAMQSELGELTVLSNLEVHH